MKIGLVGLGYWGKIVLRNLRSLGLDGDITICEQKEVDWAEIGSKYKSVKDYKSLDCEKVFVLTPATSHFDVCKFFIDNGSDVFCEKPLCLNIEECSALYDAADDNGVKLFVDWLFTFNPAVLKLKEIIKEAGKPNKIIANRLNFGPKRFDVNARWDLASHDVSILCFLLDEEPEHIKWVDFKANKESLLDDSCFGLLEYSQTCAQINASWEHTRKNRLYILDFEDFTIEWDDTTNQLRRADKCSNEYRFVQVNGEEPLKTAINEFFRGGQIHKDFTLQVTKILNHGNSV